MTLPVVSFSNSIAWNPLLLVATLLMFAKVMFSSVALIPKMLIVPLSPLVQLTITQFDITGFVAGLPLTPI